MADARVYLRDGKVAERVGRLMRFVLLTALRETRSAWKRLVFFFVCIAIGVGAIVALRSVIQSVRDVLSTEARSLMAADIFLSTDRPWQERHAGTHRGARRAHSERRAHRLDRDGDDGAAGGRARGHHEGRRASRGAAGISVLRPADAAGWAAVLSLAAAEQRRARAPGAAGAVRPVRWRRHRDWQGAVRRPRGRLRSSPAARSARSASGRACSSTTTILPRPAWSRSAAACRARCCCAFPTTEIDTLTRDLQTELQAAVRTRALVSRSSGTDRRRLRARRKLSQPGRSRHRRARRHRGVERDARVRAAEDQEHRGHEVRRRHEPSDSQRLSPSVAGARHPRQPDRRRCWRGSRSR